MSYTPESSASTPAAIRALRRNAAQVLIEEIGHDMMRGDGQPVRHFPGEGCEQPFSRGHARQFTLSGSAMPLMLENRAQTRRVSVSVRVLIVGDVMLGRLVNQKLKEAPPTYPWGDTLPCFQEAVVSACNLECVLSDRGRPWSASEKMFHFRSDSKNVAVLQAAGIGLVSIANNHVLDYEYDALLEMLEVLEQAGIHAAGAGRNQAEAWRPASLVKDGTRFGLIACTDNEPGWEAAEQKPGICYVPADLEDHRAKRLLELVSTTAAQVDCLLVSFHWGPNWGYRPPPEHVTFGRALIDAGADIVFGHSPHVFRGIELRNGKPILYSAGDFIDDYAVDEVEPNDESFLFSVEISGGAVRELALRPAVIRDFQARLAEPRLAWWIAAKMQSLCDELGTHALWDEDENLLRVPIEISGGNS